MTENSFFQRLKKLKVDLKPMTWRQRIDHIWTYYKEFILITVATLIVVIGVGSTMLAPKKELLLGGMHVNTYLSGEGSAYLAEAYFEHIQGDPEKQEVQQYFRSFGDLSTSTQDYETFQSIIALLYAQEVDYLLMNETCLTPFVGYESLMDLRQIFTEEELAEFGSRVRYGQKTDEEGNPTEDPVPVALEITDIPFIQDCESYDQKIFLGFAASAPNQDSLRDFWEYLLAWESKTEA